MIRRLLLVLFCCGLFLTAATQISKSYHAERFDVEVKIQPDGSLLVEETVRFNFTGGPFSFVFRELSTDQTDGITDIVAGVDGATWPLGDGPGEVEISGRNPIEVTWHLTPTSDTAQTFNLSYRMLGVASPGNEVDVLEYQALPDDYDYAIDNSRVTFIFPPGGSLATEPDIRAGDASLALVGDSATFEMQDLDPGDPLVVRLSFIPGAFTGGAPEWQVQQTTQRSRAWIWFASAAVILAGGFFAFYRAARPYSRSLPKPSSYLFKPPIELPPALAGYLANHTIGWHYGLATLFDLAARGYMEIEQIREKSAFRSAEFAVTLMERPQGLTAHEQALIDLLFTDKNGEEQDVVTLSDVSRLITSSRWKGYTKALENEAMDNGLIDAAAKQRQKSLVGWSVVIMVLALPLFVGSFLLREPFGLWSLVTVFAVFLLGLMGIIFSASLSLLTDKGFQYATAFEPFHHLIKHVANGKTTLPDLTYYEAYLPYATAYGYAEQWVKDQAKSDFQQVPAYFRAAQYSASEMAAFVAVISAASHSGGAASAAAGAAGAGAAGGGASGAG